MIDPPRCPLTFSIARLQLSTHDLLSSSSAPAQVEASFDAEAGSRGIICVAGDGSTTRVAERMACRSRVLDSIDFRLTEKNLFGGPRDLYLLVDYFDHATSCAAVAVNYKGYECGRVSELISDPIVFSGTHRWKRQQVILRNAAFGAAKQHADIFSIGDLYCTGRFPFGRQQFDFTLSPPAGPWKLPPLAGKHPLFAKMRFIDAERLLVIDRAQAQDPEYSCLWFDSNANHDLTDEAPLRADATTSDSVCWRSFRRIPVKVANVSYTDQLWLLMSCSSDQVKQLPADKDKFLSNMCSDVQLDCYLGGELKVNGRTVYLGLADRYCEGSFAPFYDVRKASEGFDNDYIRDCGDKLYLSYEPVYCYENRSPLGTHVALGDTLYKLDAQTSSCRLTLTPQGDAQTGVIDLPSSFTQVALLSDDQRVCVTAFDCGRQLRVPAGSYRVLSYMVEREEACGDLWRLGAAGTWKQPLVVVNAGKHTALSIGEPYKMHVSITAYPPGRSQAAKPAADDKALQDYLIQLTLTGCAGEQVTRIRHVAGANTKCPLAPVNPFPDSAKFRIAALDGELLGEGQFEFG